MRKTRYICLALLLLVPVTVWAQRRQPSGATNSPTPVPTPASSTARSGNLTQQIEDLSQQIESGMRNDQKKTIAVTELVDLNGNVTNFGRFVAEELITRLYQKKIQGDRAPAPEQNNHRTET